MRCIIIYIKKIIIIQNKCVNYNKIKLWLPATVSHCNHCIVRLVCPVLSIVYILLSESELKLLYFSEQSTVKYRLILIFLLT